MRGPYGAGAVAALFEAGFGETFDAVVGISTGAATGAYFLGGERQIALGASLYYEECTRPDFMDPWRRRKKVDIDLLINWMQDGPKALDKQAMKKHPSRFFVAAITRSGQQEFIDVKTAQPDSLTAIKASMALPGLYGEWITVNGRQYCDGGFNQPMPIMAVIKHFQPTDILILPNQTQDVAVRFRPGLGDFMAALLTLRQLGIKKSWEVFNRKDRYRRTLKSISPKSPRVAILWPPDGGLHEGTRDPVLLQAAFERSRQSAEQWLKERMA